MPSLLLPFRRTFFRDFPLARPGLLFAIAAAATLVGGSVDRGAGLRLDRFAHDAAMVAQARTTWRYTAMVTVDSGALNGVSRLQMLPLLARATEAAVAAGAKAVFLDGAVAAQPDPNIPYASCVDRSGPQPVVMLAPATCVDRGGGHLALDPGLPGMPLQLRPQTAAHFLMPRPIAFNGPPAKGGCMAGQAPARARTELLVGLAARHKVTLACVDRPAPQDGFDDGVVRTMLLTKSHAIVQLAKRLTSRDVLAAQQNDTECRLPAAQARCRRIRFGAPTATFDAPAGRPLLALSKLADCNRDDAIAYAKPLAGRAVIIQVAKFDEDLHATPLTLGQGGTHRFSPGSQVLADGVETLLAQDQPRRPAFPWRVLFFFLAGALGALAGAYLRPGWAVMFPLAIALGLTVGCQIQSDVVWLLPVVATACSAASAVAASFAIHLAFATKEGAVFARYLPEQVRALLLRRGGREQFVDQDRWAVVLMTDLRGYTTVTGLLQSAREVIALLNNYFAITTAAMRTEHSGWLEAYVGDLVCFYWPSDDVLPNSSQNAKALLGAIDLAKRQRAYFDGLAKNGIPGVPPQNATKISAILGAGIGLAAGPVCMGNLGPSDGVQKFGIIGDPLNLSSRVEALTRHFDAEIIITDTLVDDARALGLPTRRLAHVVVKGRTEAVTLYAMGDPNDPRFSKERVSTWVAWLERFESAPKRSEADAHSEHLDANTEDAQDDFILDKQTLRSWKARGLLHPGSVVFHLDSK